MKNSSLEKKSDREDSVQVCLAVFPHMIRNISKSVLISVYKGSWHGDIAIKILNMENMDDEATLEAFRLDVSTFRKTRHENLILFMGACMNPPKLAIVTSLCKGKRSKI